MYDWNKQKYKCRVCGYQFTTHEHKFKNRDKDKAKAVKLHSQGLTYRAIAEKIGVSAGLVHRWVKASKADDGVGIRVLRFNGI